MKSKEMEMALEGLAHTFFGRSRSGKVCVTCGSAAITPEDFRDDLSRKEYQISKMCQKCQDEIFGG